MPVLVKGLLAGESPFSFLCLLIFWAFRFLTGAHGFEPPPILRRHFTLLSTGKECSGCREQDRHRDGMFLRRNKLKDSPHFSKMGRPQLQRMHIECRIPVATGAGGIPLSFFIGIEAVRIALLEGVLCRTEAISITQSPQPCRNPFPSAP